jgi:2-hydroxychromene-2-carboxylate isomerase
MIPRLEFWFEFASTYSYPAAERVESVARSRGVEVDWRPFLLGPIFAAQGWTDSPFNLYPVKGRYMWRDWERICAAQGLACTRPSVFPRNGLLAARVACRFDAEPWQADFVRGVYSANFADDSDIADARVVAGVLESLALPAEEILREAQSEESKAKLRRQTERAIALEIFGAPTFVAIGELFWGNDRLDAALDRLASASRGGGQSVGRSKRSM